MKKIIKNISDVITNSSSEVFVMNKEDACEIALFDKDNETYDCISIHKMDENWVRTQGSWEAQMICDLLKIDNPFHEDFYPDEDDWSEFVDEHLDEMKEKVLGKYYIDIEDHFADAEEILEFSRSHCEWSDYRH